MRHQTGAPDDDSFAWETRFGVVCQSVVTHFLFYFKPLRLLPFLLRYGFVNINRHMIANRLNVFLFSFQQEIGLSRL